MSTKTIPALVMPKPTRSNFTLRMHVDQNSQRSPSPPGRIQLQVRRGSVSAGPDPLVRKDSPPPRNSVSRLTLVRVPQPAQSTVNSIKHSRQRSAGRNAGPHNGLESPTRLCFSSTTFGPRSPRSPTPGSPTFSSSSVGPCRPQSPSSPRQRYGPCPSSPSSTRQEQLSPSQIYDLAKTSSHPTLKGFAAAAPTPSAFAMLPDDVFLPFIDRPAEVRELVAQHSNARVMMLLAKTVSSSSSTADTTNSKTIPELASQPEAWSYEDCMAWLTGVDRNEVKDVEWVKALRLFVLARSEVLWERVKGMLGIPLELDVETNANTRVVPMSLNLSEPSCDLTINPIHPAAFTPSAIGELDEISETAEVTPSKIADQVLGLSISSIVSHPRATHSPARNRASSAPKRSSPLNPNSNASNASSPEHRPKQSIHTKRASCPKFPASFAKLGPQPTLLSVQ